MKTSRFQYQYRSNASKLHRAVGDTLRDGFLGGFEFYQEYPVNKVNPSYPDGRHKFDWVCPQLKLVIECHGKQHFTVVNFGYDTTEEAIEAFHDGQRRDKAKQQAAYEAGYNYIVVPYTLEKSINSDKLNELIKLGEEALEVYNEENAERRRLEEENKERDLAERLAAEKKAKEKEVRQRYLSSEKHMAELKKAREFRKKRYRRLKELKNNGA